MELKELRETCKNLLREKKVDFIIAYGEGTIPFRTQPIFVESEAGVEKIVWNSFCRSNLAVYLRNKTGKAGVIAKGCDSRSIICNIKEQQIDRDQLIVIGLPCYGMVDRRKIMEKTEGREIRKITEEGSKIIVLGKDFEQIFSRRELIAYSCLTCRYPNTVGYDIFVGSKREDSFTGEHYPEIEALEAKPLQERWSLFEKEFSRCLRCYACREVCPTCYCKECFVDRSSINWLGKTAELSDVMFFHLIRVFHQAGRCTNCGACEDACPMGIKLHLLTDKLQKDTKEKFGCEAGINMGDDEWGTGYGDKGF